MVNLQIPEPGDRRSSWSPGSGLVASGIVLLVALLGLALVGVRSLWTDDDEATGTASQAASSSSSTSVGEDSTQDADCPTDTSDSVPYAGPDVTWEDFSYYEVTRRRRPLRPLRRDRHHRHRLRPNPLRRPRRRRSNPASPVSIPDPIDVALQTASTQFVDNDDRDRTDRDTSESAIASDAGYDSSRILRLQVRLLRSGHRRVRPRRDLGPVTWQICHLLRRHELGERRLADGRPTGGTWKGRHPRPRPTARLHHVGTRVMGVCDHALV